MENDGLPLYPHRQLKNDPMVVPMAQPQPSILGPLPVQQSASPSPDSLLLYSTDDVPIVINDDSSEQSEYTTNTVMMIEDQLQPECLHALLGPENTITTCQFCNASIKTAVKYTTTARTHIAAALWCTICCLFCIPYGSESCKNTDHYCPNCNRYLGTYQK